MTLDTGIDAAATPHEARAAPPGRSVVQMQWRHLLFLHWPMQPDALQELLPQGVVIDTHEGRAWYGLVPFTMPDVRLRGVRWPGVHRMHECNVRTYVRVNGRPGVWFFTLDANSRLAVLGARRFWQLNYRFSDIELRRDGDRFEYTLRRLDHQRRAHLGQHSPNRSDPQPTLRCVWRVDSNIDHRIDTPLSRFLTDRYALHTVNRRGDLLEARIHHGPWSLQPAEVSELDESLTAAAGLAPAGDSHAPPVVYYSAGVDARSWALRKVEAR